MSSRRIIVTGATGLIGRQTIAPLKAQGFHVIALSKSGRPVPDADEMLNVDLLASDGPEQAIRAASASHLLHLAWHDHPKDRWTSPVNLDWVAATLRLIRVFAKTGGQRVIAAGSCAEYDWTVDGPLAETSALAPVSLYGAAKAATGNLLTAAAPSLGLTLAWARIFFCYGPGEPTGRLVGDLISGLRNGQPVECTDGLQERDYLHTGDIGRALAHVAAGTFEGAINIASGSAIPVREVIEVTARQMGHSELVRLGALSRAENDPPRIEADISRLRALGFRASFDLETGLADVIANSADT